MHPIALINAILLCVSNTSFMVAGIILNYAVIVSLLRAPQLRKKLCYFMIFVLSFSDLAAVGITHPVLISSSVLWYMQMYHRKIELTRGYAAVLLGCFSMFALLTLNIERYLATTRPFFHQTFVTKGKLTLFLAFQIITMGALTTLYSFYLKTNLYRNIFITIIVLSFLSAFLNYKILVIVKTKREDELRVAPTNLTNPGHQEARQKRRKRNLKFKNISTCSLAVGCFFVCSIPTAMYAIWILNSKAAWNDRQAMLFKIWANTFFSMNSTFNCLIFFWRHSILRREGMKIIKCLGAKRS